MTIRVGPAGWHYPDWNGIVYPEKPSRRFSPLKRIAQWFDVAEINNSFYRIPSSKHAESWLAQISEFPDFEFSAKLYQAFTHHRNYTGDDVREYQNFLKPLIEAGKLGAVLAQFPWSFKKNDENFNYLSTISETWIDYPLAIEFRHDSWWQQDVFDFLHERDICLVNIDQPPLDCNILPDDVLTSSRAYIRFHGRQSDAWWREEKYYGERYDYLYNDRELNEWAPKLKKMAQGAKSTIIIMNNHHRGDAVVNGLEIASMLRCAKGSIPAPLYNMYPERFEVIGLKKEPGQGEQYDLFGDAFE